MVSNISGTSGGTTSTGAFTSLVGTGQAWAANDIGNGAFTTMPHAGTLSSFYIEQNNSDATFTTTYTIYINGADTAVTTTLGTGATANSDTTHSVAYSAGDRVSIHRTATGTTANSGFIRWSIQSSNSASQAELLASTPSSPSTSVTSFFSPYGTGSDTTAGTNVAAVIPTGGTIKNLYIFKNTQSGAAASGKNYTITLVKNGVDQALTASIFENSQSGNDTTNTVSVTAGDLIYWKGVPANTPSNSNIGIGAEFTPTTDGESVLMFGTNTGFSKTVSRFQIPTGQPGASTTTENNATVLVQAATIKKLYASVGTAPDTGAGVQSIQFQTSVNNSAGNPSATITDTATAANDTSNTVSSTAGQRLSIKIVPSGTPTTPGTYSVGIVVIPSINSTTTSTSISTSSTSTSISTSSTSTSRSTSSTSRSTSTSSTSRSTSTSSTSTSKSTSTSSTSSSTSSTSSSISTSSTSTSSTSTSTTTLPFFTTTQSGDDSNEVISSGANDPTITGLDSASRLDGTRHGGFRFPSITIPQGSSITSATIYFEQMSNFSGLGGTIGNQTLYGEAVDNSSVFSSSNGDISGRSRTSATGTLMLDTAAAGGKSQTADVTSIVQEIVNRAGWVSGNALSTLFIGTGVASSNWIQPYMWDYFSGTYKTILTISYSGATTTSTSISTSSTSTSVSTSTSSTSSSISTSSTSSSISTSSTSSSTSISTSSTSSSTSTSQSTSTSSTSSSTSISTSSTSSSTSISTSSTSTSASTSQSTSTSSTSSSTSRSTSTSSTSTSISTSSTSSSTSVSTSSTSSSTSTSQSTSTSSTSSSTSLSTSSTSTSQTGTTTSTSTSSTSSSTSTSFSTSSTSSSTSVSTSSTSLSTSTSSTSTSQSTSTSSTSTSKSTSTSSTSSSISTSSTSTSQSTSTSSTSTSRSTSTSSTSSSTSRSTSTSSTSSSTSQSTSTSLTTSTTTVITTTSTSSTSSSTSTTLPPDSRTVARIASAREDVRVRIRLDQARVQQIRTRR